jgi:hypothetical protein
LSSLFPELYEECLTGLVEARKMAGVTQTELVAELGRPQLFVAKYQSREGRLDIAEYSSDPKRSGVLCPQAGRAVLSNALRSRANAPATFRKRCSSMWARSRASGTRFRTGSLSRRCRAFRLWPRKIRGTSCAWHAHHGGAHERASSAIEDFAKHRKVGRKGRRLEQEPRPP